MKINYLSRWDKKGSHYNQTIKVNLKRYKALQSKILCEISLKYPLKNKYCFDDYDINYLKPINNNYQFLNLTTLRFICLYLKDKRIKLNRNTIIEVL